MKAMLEPRMVAASIQLLAAVGHGTTEEADGVTGLSQGILMSGYGCRSNVAGSKLEKQIAHQ
jgi:hypothetical protein